MNYKELVKAVNDATEKNGNFSKNDLNKINVVAKELGYQLPNCSCKNKWLDLLTLEQLWVKRNPKGFPKYKWNNDMKRLLLKGGEMILKSNYTDEKVELWLEENPTKTDYFKLWNNRSTKAIKDKTNNQITNETSNEDSVKDDNEETIENDVIRNSKED